MNIEMPHSPTSDSASDAPAEERTGHVIDAKHEPYRVYHLIGDDDTVVERTAREVSEGSKLLSNVALWRANFQATLLKVRGWCDARSASLRAALVDIRSNKVMFYFVPDSTRYDLALGEAMTELEVELGGSAGIGYVESLQVPARSLERFAAPKSLIVWQRKGDDLFAVVEAAPEPAASMR
jgi:hypothetical protein